MRIPGTIIKEGKYWIVDIPILDAMTQGRTKAEAYEMAADLVENFIDDRQFKATVFPGPGNTFEVSGSDPRKLLALALKRQREASGLSLSQVAERLGEKSKNAYARYEQGVSVPSAEKFFRLLEVVAQRPFVLGMSVAK